MTRALTRLLMAAIIAGAICLTPDSSISAQEMTMMEMAKKMPNGINSIMSVNVERIINSAIAGKEGWNDSHAGKLASGLIFVPDNSKHVLVGAIMDWDSFHPRETYVLVTMDNVPPIDIIRQVTDGTVDTVMDFQVVQTNHDRYIVRIDDNLAGGMRPAIRQSFTRWLGGLKQGSEPRIRDYLEQGLGYADELGTEVVLAFNLENSVSRSRVMDRIRDSDVIRENSLNAADVSKQVASVRGLTLGITVRDGIYGAVKIEFSEDISSLKPVAKELAAAVFNRAGLHIDEFDTWQVESDDKQVKLSGEMSRESFQKVLSIVDAGSHDSTQYASSDDESYDGPAGVTKKYFDTVNSMIDSLQPRLSAGQAYTRNANWLKRYADKMDELGTLNVDPQMVDYGDFVSQSFRDASMLLIQTNESSQEKNRNLIAAGARSGGSGGRGGWGHSYNRYGWYGGASGYHRRRTGGDGSRLRSAARQNSKGEAIVSVNEVFNQISAERRNTRQTMTDKFGVQF